MKNRMGKHVALVEFKETGHHLPWQVEFASQLLDLGHQVTVYGPHPRRVEELLQQFQPGAAWQVAPALSVDTTAASPQKKCHHNWQALAQAIADQKQATREEPDLVFFMHLDYLMAPNFTARLLDAIFSWPWLGLYFSTCKTTASRKERLATWLGRGRADLLRSPNCQGVGLLDETQCERVQRLVSGKPVAIFPDFVDDTPRAEGEGVWHTIRQRAEGRTIIGAVGALARRKGITPLLRMALARPLEPYFYAFVGQMKWESFSAEEQALWKQVAADPPENCLLHLESLPSEAEFNAVVHSFDVVYAAYLDFGGSSNLLAKAAQQRRLVLGAPGECVGQRIERFHLGLCADPTKHAAMEEAVQKLAGRHAAAMSQPDWDGYLQAHARSKVGTSLETLIT